MLAKMEAEIYNKCKKILDDGGDMYELDKIVKPFREKGDLDALYFSTRYSVTEGWDDFEKGRFETLKELSKNFHQDAMADLGTIYKFDMVNSPEFAEIGEALLLGAALLGGDLAIKVLARGLEQGELNGFMEALLEKTGIDASI